MGLEVRGQGRVWSRSMMRRKGREGKSVAEEEVRGQGAMRDGAQGSQKLCLPPGDILAPDLRRGPRVWLLALRM